MTRFTVELLQPPSLTLSPEAIAILDDYQYFLQDVWDTTPASPDAVLTDALYVLTERYPAFRRWRQHNERPRPRVPQPRTTRTPFPFAPVRSRTPSTPPPLRHRKR